MRSFQLPFILLIFTSSINAQSWCPPGAEWLYRVPFPAINANGYSHLKYEGDTIVGGRLAQRLSRTLAYFHFYPPPTYGMFSHTSVGSITHEENGVVSLWSQNSWDTLYWFTGQIGDRWYGVGGSPGISWYEIIDTATTVIEDVPLRMVRIANMCDGKSMYEQWLTERRGGTYELYLLPQCIAGFDGMWEICGYRDDQIGPADLEHCIPWLPIGMEELDALNTTSVFPNPGSDHFILQLPHGKHQLQLFDALGRSVIETTINSDQAVIDTSSLPSGIYHLHVIDDSGTVTRTTWIKQ